MGDELETIVAVATPPGRGGIGVVRLSGAGARGCAEGLVRVGKPLGHGVARFGYVVDDGGAVLDEAVVTLFEGPRSYTGEDVVEVSAHGAPVLLEYLVRGAIARGARLAEPGEFTERAFLAGRLDLTQAEAVQDLIAARTLEQARTAAAQLGGVVSRAVGPVKQLLIELIAQLEAGVDFAEDDLDLLPEAEIAGRIAGVMEPLERLAASYRYGRVLREGVVLAIVGRPNAGKSSLFNRLLGRERAIVTAQAGTTRDSIEEAVELEGIPVTLVDTAGLRAMVVAPETEAEREGIARSRVTMAEADLVVQVVDATTLAAGELSAEDAATWEGLAGRARLLVVNKSDLAAVAGVGLGTSAVTGEGVEALRGAIVGAVAGRPTGDSAMVTNLRQAGVLGEALAALAKARVGVGDGVPHEFLLLDLHEGLGALDRLTGVTTPEDVLRVIFSSFCIGK